MTTLDISRQVTRPFQAGDVVLHRPTGEMWLLIVDEHNGRVVPGGWPDTRADASDCELVEASRNRCETLKMTADSPHSAAGLAARQLDALKSGRGDMTLASQLIEIVEAEARGSLDTLRHVTPFGHIETVLTEAAEAVASHSTTTLPTAPAQYLFAVDTADFDLWTLTAHGWFVLWNHWSGGTERVVAALFRKLNVVANAVLDINERLKRLETDSK